jgi:hypothetical protein
MAMLHQAQSALLQFILNAKIKLLLGMLLCIVTQSSWSSTCTVKPTPTRPQENGICESIVTGPWIYSAAFTTFQTCCAAESWGTGSMSSAAAPISEAHRAGCFNARENDFITSAFANCCTYIPTTFDQDYRVQRGRAQSLLRRINKRSTLLRRVTLG